MANWQWTGDVEIGVDGQRVATGNGDPEGVLSAPIGSLYLRADGGSNHAVYIKETGSGNTGWTAIGASGTTITLRNNAIANSLQNILDLVDGQGITISDLGSGRIQFSGPTFKHSGTTNSSQSILDIRAGTNIAVSDLGTGRIQISALPQVGIQVNSTPAASQSTLNLIAGTNFSITDLGSGQIRLDGSLGSAPVSQAAMVTTASLSPNPATYTLGNTESGFVNLSRTGLMLKIVASVPARVRLYNTAAARDADLGRVQTVPVAPGVQHGVMADLYLDGSIAPLTWYMTPPASFSNADLVHSTKIYYNISNIGVSPQAITVTITYVSEES